MPWLAPCLVRAPDRRPEVGPRLPGDRDCHRSGHSEGVFESFCRMSASGSGTLVHPISILFNKLRLNSGVEGEL